VLTLLLTGEILLFLIFLLYPRQCMLFQVDIALSVSCLPVYYTNICCCCSLIGNCKEVLISISTSVCHCVHVCTSAARWSDIRQWPKDGNSQGLLVTVISCRRNLLVMMMYTCKVLNTAMKSARVELDHL